MKDATRYYTSIPLLIIGGYALYAIYLMGGSCKGVVNTYMFIMASFVYLLALVIILAISITNAIMKKQKFNFFPLITTAILLAVLFITPAIMNWLESPPVLYASLDSSNAKKMYGMVLKKNNTFDLEVASTDYGCTYSGKYIMKGDTITLLKNYTFETDSIFSDKYVLDKTNQTLYPITKNNAIGDNSKWLRILKE